MGWARKCMSMWQKCRMLIELCLAEIKYCTYNKELNTNYLLPLTLRARKTSLNSSTAIFLMIQYILAVNLISPIFLMYVHISFKKTILHTSLSSIGCPGLRPCPRENHRRTFFSGSLSPSPGSSSPPPNQAPSPQFSERFIHEQIKQWIACVSILTHFDN